MNSKYIKYYKSFMLISKSSVNLLFIWLVFSCIYYNKFAIIGIIAIIAIIAISKTVKIHAYNEILNLKSIIYLYRIIIDIIKSSFLVIKIVYNSRKSKINSGIVTIKISSLTKAQIISLSNAITMTPGTFVIALNNQELLIHTIDMNKDVIDKEIQSLISKNDK